MKLAEITAPLEIDDLPKELITEIQECLKVGGYLQYVDGIVGSQTKLAFGKFKEDVWLEHPAVLGTTTAKALLELREKRECAAEAIAKQEDLKLLASDVLGSKTGKSMLLPTGRTVYENELILPGIPLTWGEATKGCTRIPTQVEEVINAVNLAEAFGEVRDSFGSPLAITSGFRPNRPHDINKACGGRPQSQHIYFKALDISPLNGNFSKLWLILKSSKFTGLGDGVSTGKGFYHVDIRSSGRVIFGY
ncbi:hypothetical protein FD723_39985 (plasmid) [Nostoc sp. C052]|uniref:D-Ala-D-Ala carboxypeptidase family metallohydrolase n=1 Tax=Nostoc sp. C052 TaxID=2576902 RepID=UPI0015C3637E|nr:D-Ala-D-Ala carboxypeptidase family metallohydrolase [Nostoc sp. C052]QLE46394.1 hypothetical protein FD723_39985 [Nostoc sp. C052]